MKVMLDTNILISTIFFPSAQTRQLIDIISRNHSIILCDYVIEELRLVVKRKFPSKQKALELFLMELPFVLIHTPKEIPTEGFPSVRDQKDSPILATALLEDTDVFITGDKDFLVLDIDSPQIMTMKEFLEQYSL